MSGRNQATMQQNTTFHTENCNRKYFTNFPGYTIGWGKGIPDEYTQIVDDKHREFVVPDLKPNSEYVISLRAYNNIGDGRPIYETVSKKSRNKYESSHF